MATEHLTLDAGTLVPQVTEPRVYLVVHLGDEGSRVIDLADGAEVTFGRSRSAVVHVKRDDVSRLHTRITRRGEVIEVDDLGSRNGTLVNGERITSRHRVTAGDEILIGSIHAVLGETSGLRRAAFVAAADVGDGRLAAEVDRAVRYRRPLTLALVRTADDAAIEAISTILRPMDMIAEVGGDDYLVILPELDRVTGSAAIASLLDAARQTSAKLELGSALCPDHGTTVEKLIGALRTSIRTGRGLQTPDPVDTTTTTAPRSTTPIVTDPAMKRVYALVEKVADAALTILILGETGVGKELVADAIHQASSRRARPFVKLNCAALSESLLDSELFGHERGSFTGADRRKVGFFEAAEGGTCFLDEIGEIPPLLQAKLLRVLEQKVITRVGSTVEIPIDVRMICATHRDLEAESRSERFRPDLLFRIGGFTIVVPPLRDRASEILPLAEHFLQAAAAAQGRATPMLSADAREMLVAYNWPGNVRELENVIERALVLCEDAITAADLPETLHDAHHHVRPLEAPAATILGRLADVERTAIAEALAANNNNQTYAARALGLSRRALIYKMEKYGLKPPAVSRR